VWLQDVLALRNFEISPSWHAEPLGDLLDERRQTWGTLVAGSVCNDCNNGWMSDLEHQARPILLPLLTRERTIASLTRDERFIVSRWAAKTVYTLCAAIQEQRVLAQQYEELRGHPDRLPAGAHVFAAQRECSLPAHYTVDATWQLSRKLAGEDDRLREKASYKACLQLGQLLLVVAWWPLGPDWVLDAQDGLYSLLAPEDARVIWHDGRELPQEIIDAVGPQVMYDLDHDSPSVCFGMTASIRIIHKADVPDWFLETFGITPLARP
jgi:hypothetical protein